MESGDCAVEQAPEQASEVPAEVTEVAENAAASDSAPEGATPQESSNGSDPTAKDDKKSEPSAAVTPAKTAKKAATFKMVRCNICGTQSNTQEQLQYHLNGQKHRARCLSLRIDPKLTDYPPRGRSPRMPMRPPAPGIGGRPPLLPMHPSRMGPHPGPYLPPRMGMRGEPALGGPMGMKRPYPMDGGHYSMDGGPYSMDGGPYSMDDGPYPMDSGYFMERGSFLGERWPYPQEPLPPRAAKKPRQASNMAAGPAATAKPSFFCKPCNLVLNSVYQKDEHIKGTKHKDRANQLNVSLEEAMPTPMPNPPLPGQLKQNGGSGAKQPGSKAAAKKKQDLVESCAPIRKAQQSMSYFHKPGSRPLLCCTTGDVVDKTAAARGDRIAVVSCHQGISKTYTEYKKDIDQLAAGLVSLKLGVGSKMGIVVPNVYEWAVVQFAAAKAGLVLVSITTECDSPELEHCLKHVDCEAVILSERFASQDYYAMLLEIAPELESSKPGELKCARLPRLKHVVLIADSAKPGTVTYDELVQSAENLEVDGAEADGVEADGAEADGAKADGAEADGAKADGAKADGAKADGAKADGAKADGAKPTLPEVQYEDPVSIHFTSGTTGKPKSVLLSHFNVVNNAETAGHALGFPDHNDTVCLTVPMSHPLGCIIGTLAAVTFGRTLVIPAPSFDPATTLEAIKDKRCTTVYGTPSALALLPEIAADQIRTSTLRKAIVVGSSCSWELIKGIRKKLSIGRVHVIYGSAECSPAIAVSKPEWSGEDWMRTVGTPIDHVEVKVVDLEGKLVPLNNRGELCVRGHPVFMGYCGDEEKTKEVVRNGWYHTGDEATLSEDGRVTVWGRIQDKICLDDEVIDCWQIEECLSKHASIEEAQVVAVSGQICACIKLKPESTVSEEEVKDFCKEKISESMIPKNILFVESIPKSALGEVQKFKIRIESQEELGL